MVGCGQAVSVDSPENVVEPCVVFQRGSGVYLHGILSGVANQAQAAFAERLDESFEPVERSNSASDGADHVLASLLQRGWCGPLRVSLTTRVRGSMPHPGAPFGWMLRVFCLS